MRCARGGLFARVHDLPTVLVSGMGERKRLGYFPRPESRDGWMSFGFSADIECTWILSHICLAHEGAASNGKRKTGKKIGSIGGQEGDGMGQVVGLGKASDRRTSGGS